MLEQGADAFGFGFVPPASTDLPCVASNRGCRGFRRATRSTRTQPVSSPSSPSNYRTSRQCWPDNWLVAMTDVTGVTGVTGLTGWPDDRFAASGMRLLDVGRTARRKSAPRDGANRVSR